MSTVLELPHLKALDACDLELLITAADAFSLIADHFSQLVDEFERCSTVSLRSPVRILMTEAKDRARESSQQWALLAAQARFNAAGIEHEQEARRHA